MTNSALLFEMSKLQVLYKDDKHIKIAEKLKDNIKRAVKMRSNMPNKILYYVVKEEDVKASGISFCNYFSSQYYSYSPTNRK